MDMTIVNENDVTEVKTGRGYTKFLVTNKRGEGASIMIRIWGPDTNIETHSHPFAEMFYVLDGEVVMGDTAYTQGACIYIPAGVPYGPTTAPKGARLLRYVESGEG